MNKRIKLLAEQAGMVYHSEHQYDDFDEQKFAELLIRECAGLVNLQLQHNNPNDSLLALKIKEHFGVE